MKRRNINSSIIKSIGHENDVLEVEFNTGKIYKYPASRGIYEQMLKSDSIGRFFKTRIQERKIKKTEDEFDL